MCCMAAAAPTNCATALTSVLPAAGTVGATFTASVSYGVPSAGTSSSRTLGMTADRLCARVASGCVINADGMPGAGKVKQIWVAQSPCSAIQYWYPPSPWACNGNTGGCYSNVNSATVTSQNIGLQHGGIAACLGLWLSCYSPFWWHRLHLRRANECVHSVRSWSVCPCCFIHALCLFVDRGLAPLSIHTRVLFT